MATKNEQVKPVAGTAIPSDRLVTELYVLIQNGELSPGQHVDQRSIAERLNVSRTPLREALRASAVDGVLDHSKNQGYVVAKLNAANLLELYSLRSFVESQLLRTVEWPNATRLRMLKQRNEECRRASVADDISRTLTANRDFYFGIFEWSPLTVLLKEAERLWRVSEPYRAVHVSYSEFRHSLGQVHDVVIDAIVDQDRDRLISLIDLRRKATMEALLGILGSRVDDAHRQLPQVSAEFEMMAPIQLAEWHSAAASS